MPISQPPLIEVPFAESGLKNAIPANANNVTGNAGFDLGFPPINLTAVAAGGIPPFGQDMNGILYDITNNIQFQQTGTPTVYDPAFAAAITGYPQGAKLLKADGSGWWINTLAGNTSDPDLGGANWISVPFSFFSTPITPVSIGGLYSNLKLSATGTNATVTISANSVILADGLGGFIVDNNINSTINTATVGVGGLDTGTLSASTWYSVWRIGKDDGTTGGIISLSSTSPTMPLDYVFKARIGWVRTDSTANKFPVSMYQSGNVAEYIPLSGTNLASYPVMASGSAAAKTAVAWSSYAPPTAGRMKICVAGSNSASTGLHGSANGPELFFNSPITSAAFNASTDVALYGPNIYWQSSNGELRAIGWEDNL